MRTLTEISRAINRADQAGDVEAVKKLKEFYRQTETATFEKKYGITPQRDESGFFENVAKGFGSGYVGTIESAALGAATLLEEENELNARRKIKNFADRFTPEGGDPDSIAYKLASGIGSIGAFATAAPFGKVAALGTAGALGVGAGAGEASERARAYGATEEERNVAVRKGALIGATEVLPLGRLAKNLQIPGLPDVLEKIGKKVSPETITGIKSRLQRAAATGVAEGAQEAAAAVLQNLTEQGYNPEQVLFEAGVIEEGAIGGGAGAILQGLVDLFAPRKIKTPKDDAQAETKETPAEDPTPAETAKPEEAPVPEPKVKAKARPKKEEKPDKEVAKFQAKNIKDLTSSALSASIAPDAVERSARNAGLPIGTYELMVKRELKERGQDDVREQVTRTPDTTTARESIPSSARVVGDERADGAKEPRRPVKGGLDDSKRDARRPARRKEKSTPSVAARIYNTISTFSETDREKALKRAKKELNSEQYTELESMFVADKKQKTATPSRVIPKVQPKFRKEMKKMEKARKQEEKEVKVVADEVVTEPSIADIPAYDSETKKLSFKATKKLVKPHAATKDDDTRLEKLVLGARPSQEQIDIEKIPAKKRTKAERQKLKSLKEKLKLDKKASKADKTVVRYLNNFKTPMDGLYAAIYEVADAKSAAVYAPTEGAKNVDPLQEYTVGTGGSNAKAVVDWAEKNLSKETNRQLRARRREFAKEAAALKKRMDSLKEGAKESADTKTTEATKKASEQVKRMIDRQRAAGPVTVIKGDKRTTVAAGKVKDIDETKLSKEDKAKLSADENFTNFINRPRTDLRKVNDFEKAREYAEKSTDPKNNLDTLKTLRAKAFNDQGQATRAAKRVDQRIEAAKKTPSKKVTKKARDIAKAMKKLKGKGVTREGLVLLYKDEGPKYLLKDATVKEAREYSKLAAVQKELGYKMYQNDGKVSNQMSAEVSDKVMSSLKENDIKSALEAARAQVKDPKIRSIFTSLSKNMGTTKVMFLSNDMMNQFLDDGDTPKGVINEGVFEPISNIIYLNEDFPVSVHTLGHEATHAATYVYMKANPNDKVVKDLESLYEQLLEMGVLDKQYAKIDVYEFVSEVFSNPEMRRILSRMRVDKGGKVRQATLYEKFVNMIKNILNRFRKDDLISVDSALTEADRAITQILAPSPNVWDGTLQLEPKLMARSIDEALAERRTTAQTGSFKDFWKNLTAGAKGLKGLAMGIDIQTLGDIGRSTGFDNLIQELHEAINRQTGNVNEARDLVTEMKQANKKFAKTVGKDGVEIYNRIVYNYQYGATLHDVNPFAGKSYYKNKVHPEEGYSLQDVYDLQQQQLNKLSPENYKVMKKHYESQKRFYRTQFERIISALKQETQKVAEAGNTQAVKALDKITRDMFKRSTIKEYFPLVREGRFKVAYDYSVLNPDGSVLREESGFEMFKNIAERDAYVKELKEEPLVKTSSIKTYNQDVNKDFFGGAPKGSFMSNILQTLENAGVKGEVQEAIIRQYVNTLPETSIYRSMLRRGKVFGYVEDATIALETRGQNLAVQAARIESAADIHAQVRKIEQRNKELNNDKAQAIHDVAIQEHANFALHGAPNKGVEAIAKEFNQIAFLYTLGFNISSAVVNLSQIPLFAVPYLAARFGFSNTYDAFSQASRIVGGAKLSVIEYYDNGFNLKDSVKKKIEKNASKEDAAAKIEYLESIIPLVKEARQQGKFYSANTLLELGVTENANKRDKLAHFSAFFFNGAERFNTQTTIIASYDLIRQQMAEKASKGEKYFSVRDGKEIDVPSDVNARRAFAAKEALYTAKEVNGGSRLETTAPVAKKHIGRVALMYKSYGLAMNTAMIKSGLIAADKLYENNPEQRAIAIKQLAGVHLSSLLFAGLGGVPIWGLVSMVWDLFLDDEEDDADTILRKHVGELGFKGPLSTLTGVDVSARVKLNDLIIQENRFMRDPSLEETLGYYLGGPALSTAKRFARGVTDAGEGEYMRAFEAALPAGGANLLTAVRYFAEGGIQTRRDDFIYEDVGASEIATKAFGFAPVEYTFRTSQSARNKKVSNAIMTRRSKLTKQYYLAIRNQDHERADDILTDMVKFNERHPTAAINALSIRRSVKSHFKTSALMHNGVTVSPLLRYALEESNLEYKKWD